MKVPILNFNISVKYLKNLKLMQISSLNKYFNTKYFKLYTITHPN